MDAVILVELRIHLVMSRRSQMLRPVQHALMVEVLDGSTMDLAVMHHTRLNALMLHTALNAVVLRPHVLGSHVLGAQIRRPVVLRSVVLSAAVSTDMAAAEATNMASAEATHMASTESAHVAAATHMSTAAAVTATSVTESEWAEYQCERERRDKSDRDAANHGQLSSLKRTFTQLDRFYPVSSRGGIQERRVTFNVLIRVSAKFHQHLMLRMNL